MGGGVGELLVRAGAFGRLYTSYCKDLPQRTRRQRDCKSGRGDSNGRATGPQWERTNVRQAEGDEHQRGCHKDAWHRGRLWVRKI